LLVGATAIIVALALIAPTAVAARQRYPVMGCFNFNFPSPNLYSLAYKPYGRCYSETGIDGIDRVRWSHWGRSRASGHGEYLDSLGFPHKASMTIYGLFHPCRFAPGQKTYSKLRVVWQSVRGGGVLRPGGQHEFDVTPSDVGC
jgi:hypothetical protein